MANSNLILLANRAKDLVCFLLEGPGGRKRGGSGRKEKAIKCAVMKAAQRLIELGEEIS